MKRFSVVVVALLVAIGCGGRQHPAKIYVDDTMKEGVIEKVAVFPFASAVHHSDDPDKLAPRMMDKLFLEQLDLRNDYKFVAPASVIYALERGQLEEQGRDFIDGWTKTQKVDLEFLNHLGQILNLDAVLIGVVEQWQKDEVDIQENATPATYVGATVTILSVQDGTILFQATDEDFLEGVRSETSDRSVRRSPTGAIYNDPREKLFRAPPYESVAVRVAMALAASIPAR